MKLIKFTAIVKDGGYEAIQITPQMFSELALAIQEKGSEHLHLKDRSIVVVGILKIGKEVGERVIMCGDFN
jgi:hypothetical protein